MKGIHPDTCIHHIYTQAEETLVRQPQRRMNLTLKDIVKEEIPNLLNVGFIYPISDSKWVTLLVVKLPPPKTQKEVRIFLGHAGYYRRFIENFTKIDAPMFGLLTKDVDFLWTD